MSASTTSTAHQDASVVNDVPPEDETSSAIDDDDDHTMQGSASVKRAKLELAQKETTMVFRSRVVFCLFLGILSVTVGISTYRLSVDVEDGDFETRFDDFARQVIEVSQINADNIFERYKTMGMQLTAYSLHAQQEWPFVQMPRFGAQSSATAMATGADYFLFAPVVRAEQREEYEEFAMNHRDWIQEALDYSMIPVNASDLKIAPTILPVTFPGGQVDLLSLLPFHLPVAQITSVERYSIFVNLDIATDRNMDVAFKVMNETRSSVMSGIFRPRREGGSPASFLATPIFDSFDSDAQIVGVFSGFLFWHKNFEKLLPPGSEPLILVVQNCDEFISFRIDGPEVTYLGYGDEYRDLKYDAYKRQGTFAPYQSSTGCDFIVNIYPTSDFEAAYRTNDPLVKTVAITLCFVVTALLFFFYNFVVEYRQKKLVQGARQNSELVGSLFPEGVRDRLVEYAGNKEHVSHVSSPIASVASPFNGAPIADRFECATVFFADIAGFTKWSSTRDPEQVFVLLETLYNAFDQIATRLGVFKVETIGDCYMAVTGLPKLRADHAALMVKFARSCLTRMSQLLPMLEESLGKGTMDLAMRIGMHSGPVTAGVLRGEKSRFQLFGDTVNTASRMESNGQPGRIHVSSETADELIRLGKGKWLTPRNDAIVAKGKGAMKTFWINFGNVSTGLTTFTQGEQRGCADEPTSHPDHTSSKDDCFQDDVSVNGTHYV